LAAFQSCAEAVAWLRSSDAVRRRCEMVLAAGRDGALDHFSLDEDRVGPAAAFVAETIRLSYPNLDVPGHSRWRHFAAGGVDRWGQLAERQANLPAEEIARIRFDLAVTSVLLDAGAGGGWSFDEPGGGVYARSEGLAVASFHLFADGGFSADPDWPWRADGAALAALDDAALARAFQVGDGNPLVGLDGRAALIRNLGAAVIARPDLFGADRPRIGGLFDTLAVQARDGALPAQAVLGAVLDGFGPIWPGRIELDGVNLGDVWRHPAARAGDMTDGLVPFHKLSQWLSYSLIEPLEAAGIAVIDLDGLTGLPEYRNGGLLVDLGVLRPKQAAILTDVHDVGSEVVVEWRALTVALLDLLADAVRQELGVERDAFPLAKVLEGGTWSAGRRIAAERRADGGPPIRVRSDGTVF